MKKNKPNWKIVFYLVAIISLVALISLYANSQAVYRQVTSIDGYIQMEISRIAFGGETASVTLKNQCNGLTIFVTGQQAQSIQTGATNIIAFRPTTHDIFASVLKRYDIKPILVKITKLEKETYFAELTFKRGLEYLTVDIRPSDALAVATRMNTPIYVNNSLVINVC